MPIQKKNLLQDIVFIGISIVVAILVVQSDILHTVVVAMGPFSYLASILAGIFFVSVFTFAPAIAILIQLAGEHSLITISLLGGLGAVIGDFILFLFVRTRLAEDVAFILSGPKIGRFKKMLTTTLPKWFTPMLGALIIASPFPDEIGLTLLGLSKISTRSFILISFVLNTLGLLITTSLALSLVNTL